MTSVEEGNTVVADAENGIVHLRPDSEMLASFQNRLALRSQRLAAFAAIRDTKAVSRDGVGVTLMMNAGLSLDMEQLDASGAEGIGLFRTEFQFPFSERLPKIDEQVQFYSDVLDKAGKRAVLLEHSIWWRQTPSNACGKP